MSLACAFVLISLIQNVELPKVNKIEGNDGKKGFVYAQKTQVPLAQIFGKRDIFGLAVSDAVVEQSKNISANNIPKLVIPEIPKPSALPAIDFIPPLSLVLRGVIWSVKPEQSMCIVADETEKELTLKLGDKIKDGTVIKILRDRMVVLRLSGQLETFFINESSLHIPSSPVSAIQSLGENRYSINVDKFKQSVQNIGSLLDNFDAVPLVGEDGKMMAIVVVETDPSKLPAALGFSQNDLIVTIADIDVSSNKSRSQIYDELTSNKKIGEEFSIEFVRQGKVMSNSYMLIGDSRHGAENLASLKMTNDNQSSMRQLVTKKDSDQSLSSMFTNNRRQSELEVVNEEERKKSEDRYQENIKRIRQEMLDRIQKRSS